MSNSKCTASGLLEMVTFFLGVASYQPDIKGFKTVIKHLQTPWKIVKRRKFGIL